MVARNNSCLDDAIKAAFANISGEAVTMPEGDAYKHDTQLECVELYKSLQQSTGVTDTSQYDSFQLDDISTVELDAAIKNLDYDHGYLFRVGGSKGGGHYCYLYHEAAQWVLQTGPGSAIYVTTKDGALTKEAADYMVSPVIREYEKNATEPVRRTKIQADEFDWGTGKVLQPTVDDAGMQSVAFMKITPEILNRLAAYVKESRSHAKYANQAEADSLRDKHNAVGIAAVKPLGGLPSPRVGSIDMAAVFPSATSENTGDLSKLPDHTMENLLAQQLKDNYDFGQADGKKLLEGNPVDRELGDLDRQGAQSRLAYELGKARAHNQRATADALFKLTRADMTALTVVQVTDCLREDEKAEAAQKAFLDSLKTSMKLGGFAELSIAMTEQTKVNSQMWRAVERDDGTELGSSDQSKAPFTFTATRDNGSSSIVYTIKADKDRQVKSVKLPKDLAEKRGGFNDVEKEEVGRLCMLADKLNEGNTDDTKKIRFHGTYSKAFYDAVKEYITGKHNKAGTDGAAEELKGLFSGGGKPAATIRDAGGVSYEINDEGELKPKVEEAAGAAPVAPN